VVYGGLLFQPMSLDLLEAYRISDLRVRHFFDFFVNEQIYRQHPEVIILTNILPDPINTYLMPYRSSIVDEINGQKIGTLQDLARAFEQPAERFVIKMIGDGPPLVLDPKQVESARERIKTRYNVLVRHWSVADRRAHEQMGFHAGWGQCADQLAALLARTW